MPSVPSNARNIVKIVLISVSSKWLAFIQSMAVSAANITVVRRIGQNGCFASWRLIFSYLSARWGAARSFDDWSALWCLYAKPNTVSSLILVDCHPNGIVTTTNQNLLAIMSRQDKHFLVSC